MPLLFLLQVLLKLFGLLVTNFDRSDIVISFLERDRPVADLFACIDVEISAAFDVQMIEVAHRSFPSMPSRSLRDPRTRQSHISPAERERVNKAHEIIIINL